MEIIMLKRLLLLAYFSMIVSACNLNQTTPASSEILSDLTPELIVSNTVIAAVSSPTATSIAATVTPTIQPSLPATSSDCIITRTDLSIYIVNVGDTLSNIAVRSNSTIAELAQINCLSDPSMISVGQALYVPDVILLAENDDPQNQPSENVETSNDSQSSTTSNTNMGLLASSSLGTIRANSSAIQGIVLPSPWIVNYENVFVVEENTTITLNWSEFPANMTYVEFFIEPNNKIGGHTVLGTDTDLSDGASIQWSVPINAQVEIFAVGQVAGSSELMLSNTTRFGARNSSEELQERQYGSFSLSPSLQGDDISQVLVDPNNVTITLNWVGLNAFHYHILDGVNFYYRSDDGSVSLIGTDTDETDGISLTWTTFPDMAGVIYAEGTFILTAPQVFYTFLTTWEIRVDALLEGCLFNPFGIGGDIPVYPSPDSSTVPIRSIQMGVTYPIIEIYDDTFYHIDLGNQSGWVIQNRGARLGDCP